MLKASMDLLPGWSDLTVFGFLGVNIFFMISGFIIFSSASNRNVLDFAVYRWIRLYPTYWVSIVFTIILLWFFLGNNLSLGPFEIIANFSMIQPYLGVGHLDPVYWTLVVELHFYALITVAMATRQLAAYRFWITVWLISTLTYRFFEQPFFLKYIISPKYSAYFIIGMTLCSLRFQPRDLWGWVMLPASFIVACTYLPKQIALYNFGVSNVNDILIGYTILLITLIFLTGISLNWMIFKNHRLILFAGGLTYPLYLTHHLLGRYLIDTLYGEYPGWLILIFCICISLLVATVVHWIGDRWLANYCRYLYKNWFRAKYSTRQTTTAKSVSGPSNDW